MRNFRKDSTLVEWVLHNHYIPLHSGNVINDECNDNSKQLDSQSAGSLPRLYYKGAGGDVVSNVAVVLYNPV